MSSSVANALPRRELPRRDPASAAIRCITPEQLQRLGVSQVAYLKAYCVRDRGQVYVIHAADGRALAMSDDPATSARHARDNNLFLVSVH